MEYHEAANFLFDLRRYPPRMGLEPTRRLLAHLGDPQEELRVVQVAGSNGKGSTARMVERVLREAGFDVGLYTSPQLDDVRERVRINGRMVSKRTLTAYAERVTAYVDTQVPDGSPPTFFEVTTALALWAFARADVDVAVLEVGIGGRYDATSVTAPAASAVTTVTLEHADVLGDTIAEIARDKAAVASEDAPLVTAATGEALDAITDDVADVCRVGTDDEADVRVTDHGRDGLEQAVEIAGVEWRVETAIPLLGTHQVRNAGVAAALVRQLADVSERDIASGLRNAHWPGRFEVLGRDPLVIADGAHNPAGCAAFAETLSTFEYDRLHVVFGAMVDKDHAGMVEALPAADAVYTCRPDIGRAEVPSVLAATFDAVGQAGEIHEFDAVDDALGAALDDADAGDAVVVAGSLFTVAEGRHRWTRLAIPTRVEDRSDERATLARADVPPDARARVRNAGVHHTVRTRVQPRQARRLQRELEAVGGSCAISGLDVQDRELVDAVMFGTRAQFDRFVDRLAGQQVGLSAIADELREALTVETATGDDGYPWYDRTAVMGILNVTPDSFYDGGRYEAVEDAVEQAERMVEAGADIVDVGGESTRPGAEPVSVDEERNRVVPVVEALAGSDVLVSVDTRKPEVARAALEAGADILNDVDGLESPQMRATVAEYDVPVVVMHSLHTPVDPTVDVEYDDVVSDTIDALAERLSLAERAGIDRSKVIVDPGLGFGKSATESFELLDRLEEFRALGCPILVGHSRKSMFGLIGEGDSDNRLAATVAATALATERGADIVRVHDVSENVSAVRTAAAVSDPERVGDE